MKATYVDCIGCNAELFTEELTQRGIYFDSEESPYNDDYMFYLYSLSDGDIAWVESLNEEGITIN